MYHLDSYSGHSNCTEYESTSPAYGEYKISLRQNNNMRRVFRIPSDSSALRESIPLSHGPLHLVFRFVGSRGLVLLQR